jgi:hypothetical protein
VAPSEQSMAPQEGNSAPVIDATTGPFYDGSYGEEWEGKQMVRVGDSEEVGRSWKFLPGHVDRAWDGHRMTTHIELAGLWFR